MSACLLSLLLINLLALQQNGIKTHCSAQSPDMADGQRFKAPANVLTCHTFFLDCPIHHASLCETAKLPRWKSWCTLIFEKIVQYKRKDITSFLHSSLHLVSVYSGALMLKCIDTDIQELCTDMSLRSACWRNCHSHSQLLST